VLFRSQNIEQNILALEQDPASPDAIHAIFRAFHTIKGLAGFLEFQEIREVAHETETVLDRARNGELALTPTVLDVILESSDYLGTEVKRISAGGQAPSGPTSALIARLRAVLEDKVETIAEVKPRADKPGVDKPSADDDLAALSRAVEQTAQKVEPAPAPAPEKKPAVPAAEARGKVEAPAAPKPAPQTDEAAPAPEAGRTDIAASSIKVQTSKLDSLVDMVGEMVIAQSLVRHSPDLAGLQSAPLLRNVAQLSRITDEVQKTVMSMRMIPIGILFRKMARLVRDVSRKAGKPAELVISGEETELDRNIVEELADPLMHMLRNAVDHGIEPPEKRSAAGKPAMGRIHLGASHQAGNIVVEVSDDGRGMDAAAILRKAREKGIVGSEAHLSNAEIYNLIFEPGFSTAAQVTDISGRGVGMDVVRRHIQKLRGRTEIVTELGKGSTFRIKLPLTLAIIDGLIVGVGKERYIIPIFAVKEMLRPSPGMITTLENRHEMALVRDRLLPVRRLSRIFGVKPRSEVPEECLFVVMESQAGEYCLMVDTLIGKQEVVIKSLGDMLRQSPGVAGGAILGDGRVGLILEANALFSVAANAC
jgi:two-component system chemotaxis sensor kinase CheA